MNAEPEDSPPLSRTPLDPRAAALWVARKLRDAGFRALFAGGCVRDALLGHTAADHDIATNASPDEIRRIFPRAIGVGESFGVMLVRHGGRSIEVATFRADGAYKDGRRPEAVRFSDDREDAARRDFTINGLFEDPETGAIIDHVGGRADLAAGILRAIGDPHARLQEDRLRALRAARFAARFDLRIDPETQAAVTRFALDLQAVSPERIGNEIRRMLSHRSRARAVELMESMGLAASALGEPLLVSGVLHLEPLQALQPGACFEEALAAWMLARPASLAEQSAPNLSGADQSLARQRRWREQLVLSNSESDLLAAILTLRRRIQSEWAGGDQAKRKRLASSMGFDSALALLAAERHPMAARVHADLVSLKSQGLQPAPFVTGDDLITLGMAPGPSFRPTLDRAYDLQLNGMFSDRAAALHAVRGWLGGR